MCFFKIVITTILFTTLLHKGIKCDDLRCYNNEELIYRWIREHTEVSEYIFY